MGKSKVIQDSEDSYSKRDSFVFYRSFYEASKDLKNEEFISLIKAIIEYALDGIEHNLDGIPDKFFILMKPNLDANNKKYIDGLKGGRPLKKTNDENTNLDK